MTQMMMTAEDFEFCEQQIMLAACRLPLPSARRLDDRRLGEGGWFSARLIEFTV